MGERENVEVKKPLNVRCGPAAAGKLHYGGSGGVQSTGE